MKNNNKLSRQQKRQIVKHHEKSLRKKGCENFNVLVNLLEPLIEKCFNEIPTHFVALEPDFEKTERNKFYYGCTPPIMQCDFEPSLMLTFLISDGFGHRDIVYFDLPFDFDTNEFNTVQLVSYDSYTKKTVDMGDYEAGALLFIQKLSMNTEIMREICTAIRTLIRNKKLKSLNV